MKHVNSFFSKNHFDKNLLSFGHLLIVRFFAVCLLFILSFSYFSGYAQCTLNFTQIPNHGHYCLNSDSVFLQAWDSAQTGGCWYVPVFVVYISLDTISNDSDYFFTAYQNGGATPTLRANPVSVCTNNEWIIDCYYFSTSGGFCSFKFCDRTKLGSFPYKVYDRNHWKLIASGTILGFDSCTTVVLPKLSGIARFSGPGVKNNNNGFGTFDPALAGPGIHNIQYYWSDGMGFADSVSQADTVYALPVIDMYRDDSMCPGTSITLNPNYNGTATYTWSNHSHGKVLNVNKPGKYSVIVTDTNNCSSYDTVHVFLYPVGKVNLGPNDTVKKGEPFPILNAGTGYLKYTWQDGSGNPTDTVTHTGKYWVTVIDKHGCILSDTIIIYEAGINEKGVTNNKLQVYPNPASTVLYIDQRNINDLKSVYIYDLTGRILHNEIALNNTIQKISVSGLATGIYFLELVKANGEKATFKFVKD